MKKLLILLISLLVVSVVSAQTTYRDGDAYIGENTYDPNWIWNLNDLYSTGSTRILGIENDFVWNDDSDNPAGVGQCISLPNEYIRICLDGLTYPNYYSYIFEFDGDADLSEASASGSLTSVPTFYLNTNRPNGFKILNMSSGMSGSSSITADKIWLYLNGANVDLYYEDINGKTRKAGTVGLNADFATINDGATPPIDMILSKSGEDYTLTLESNILSDVTEKIIMKIGVGNGFFDALGSTLSLSEPDELVWERYSKYNNPQYTPTSFNIGTKDEDHRSMYGIIIKNPQSKGTFDQVSLSIPEKQVKAKISIKGPSSGLTDSYESALGIPLKEGPTDYYGEKTAITFKGQTYWTNEHLIIGSSSKYVWAATSLSSNEDDYGTNVFLETDVDSIMYNYEFSSNLNLKDVSSSTPLDIQFLGQPLKITAVPEPTKIVVGSSTTCTDSDGGKDYYVQGTTVLGSEAKTDSCTYCTGYCAPGAKCPPPTCGGVVEYYCENNMIKSGEYVCPNNCKDGACITKLNDIQVTACKAADKAGTCDKLSNLGIITAEQCCAYLSLCCPLNTVTLAELKEALIKAIINYFKNPNNPALTVPEIKDLIVAYLTAPTDTVDLSGTGTFSGEKLIDIYNKAKEIII